MGEERRERIRDYAKEALKKDEFDDQFAALLKDSESKMVSLEHLKNRKEKDGGVASALAAVKEVFADEMMAARADEPTVSPPDMADEDGSLLQQPFGVSQAGTPPEPPPDEENKGTTVADWMQRQHEFADLPPIPEGWIRIRSNSSGTIYFLNVLTGLTSFEQPTDSLPDGWASTVSRSTGQTYYYHAASGTTTFERPTS